MFQSARIKLAAWYVLIIAIVSVLFSLTIFKVSTREFEHIKEIEQHRLDSVEYLSEPPPTLARRIASSRVNIQSVNDAEERLALSLIAINLAILVLSGVAGYFLAGRTLRPIKEMVDEQNRFITDASHELRTPLTSLKSEIEVNLRDRKLSVADARKLLSSNLEEVNNLQSLSDNLIKLTQYQKQNDAVALDEIELKSVLTEAVKRVSSFANLAQISIENNASNFKLQAETASLIELFVILLDNAIKYSPKNSTVKITTKKTDHSVQIRVIDQGIGIDEADLPHLFDRFYRADKSRTKADIPGYGLGLSIARQIVDKHHGTIKVESQPKKGTTFVVQLPLKR